MIDAQQLIEQFHGLMPEGSLGNFLDSETLQNARTYFSSFSEDIRNGNVSIEQAQQVFDLFKSHLPAMPTLSEAEFAEYQLQLKDLLRKIPCEGVEACETAVAYAQDCVHMNGAYTAANLISGVAGIAGLSLSTAKDFLSQGGLIYLVTGYMAYQSLKNAKQHYQAGAKTDMLLDIFAASIHLARAYMGWSFGIVGGAGCAIELTRGAVKWVQGKPVTPHLSMAFHQFNIAWIGSTLHYLSNNVINTLSLNDYLSNQMTGIATSIAGVMGYSHVVSKIQTGVNLGKAKSFNLAEAGNHIPFINFLFAHQPDFQLMVLSLSNIHPYNRLMKRNMGAIIENNRQSPNTKKVAQNIIDMIDMINALDNFAANVGNTKGHLWATKSNNYKELQNCYGIEAAPAKANEALLLLQKLNGFSKNALKTLIAEGKTNIDGKQKNPRAKFLMGLSNFAYEVVHHPNNDMPALDNFNTDKAKKSLTWEKVNQALEPSVKEKNEKLSAKQKGAAGSQESGALIVPPMASGFMPMYQCGSNTPSNWLLNPVELIRSILPCRNRRKTICY